MAKHTSKILRCSHFLTLCMKGLKSLIFSLNLIPKGAKLSFLQHFLFLVVIKVSITTKYVVITLPIIVTVKILTCESFVDVNLSSEEVYCYTYQTYMELQEKH